MAEITAEYAKKAYSRSYGRLAEDLERSGFARQDVDGFMIYTRGDTARYKIPNWGHFLESAMNLQPGRTIILDDGTEKYYRDPTIKEKLQLSTYHTECGQSKRQAATVRTGRTARAQATPKPTAKPVSAPVQGETRVWIIVRQNGRKVWKLKWVK